jgi:hypothetical protein
MFPHLPAPVWQLQYLLPPVASAIPVVFHQPPFSPISPLIPSAQVRLWYDMIRYDIFISCNWVATRWQQYSTHLHTNSTQNNTIDTKQYTEQHNSQLLLSRYSDWLRAGRSGDRIPVGTRFSAPVQTGPGAHPASSTMGTGSSGGKAARAWRWPPTPSSSEVKERVELYIYSPCGSSWPVVGCTLAFILFLKEIILNMATWIAEICASVKLK